METEPPHGPAPAILKGYFTPKDLAERWGVSAGTIRLWINSGMLEACRVGPRLLKVPADKVAAYERTTGLRAPCA